MCDECSGCGKQLAKDKANVYHKKFVDEYDFVSYEHEFWCDYCYEYYFATCGGCGKKDYDSNIIDVYGEEEYHLCIDCYCEKFEEERCGDCGKLDDVKKMYKLVRRGLPDKFLCSSCDEGILEGM